MRIDITLGGALIKLLPEGETGNRFSHTSEGGLSLGKLLDELGVSAQQRLLTILNGDVIQPESYAETMLRDGDQLSLMPPIVAG